MDSLDPRSLLEQNHLEMFLKFLFPGFGIGFTSIRVEFNNNEQVLTKFTRLAAMIIRASKGYSEVTSTDQ